MESFLNLVADHFSTLLFAFFGFILLLAGMVVKQIDLDNLKVELDKTKSNLCIAVGLFLMVIALSLEFVPPQSKNLTKYHVVNVLPRDSLHVHSRPDLSDKTVVGSIPSKGENIKVTGVCKEFRDRVVQENNNLWVPIIYKNTKGWVNSYYLNNSN
jgi:hypothetical protein